MRKIYHLLPERNRPAPRKSELFPFYQNIKQNSSGTAHRKSALTREIPTYLSTPVSPREVSLVKTRKSSRPLFSKGHRRKTSSRRITILELASIPRRERLSAGVTGTFPVKFLIENNYKRREPNPAVRAISLSLESSVELILNLQRLCTGLWTLSRLSQ